METINEAYITMPKGFKASGICADLKGEGKLDFALVASDVPATVSGVYTSNLVKGHSLQRMIKLVADSQSFNRGQHGVTYIIWKIHLIVFSGF